MGLPSSIPNRRIRQLLSHTSTTGWPPPPQSLLSTPLLTHYPKQTSLISAASCSVADIQTTIEREMRCDGGYAGTVLRAAANQMGWEGDEDLDAGEIVELAEQQDCNFEILLLVARSRFV